MIGFLFQLMLVVIIGLIDALLLGVFVVIVVAIYESIRVFLFGKESKILNSIKEKLEEF